MMTVQTAQTVKQTPSEYSVHPLDVDLSHVWGTPHAKGITLSMWIYNAATHPIVSSSRLTHEIHGRGGGFLFYGSPKVKL